MFKKFKLIHPLHAIHTPLQCSYILPKVPRPIHIPPQGPEKIGIDTFYEEILSWHSSSKTHQFQSIVVTELWLFKEDNTLALHEYICARVEVHLDDRIEIRFLYIERLRGKPLIDRTSFLGFIERAMVATCPSLSITGDATPEDVVFLLDKKKRKESDVLHRTLRFTNPIPLARVIALANLLHVNHNRYRLCGENCYLFAGEICDVLEADTDPRYLVQRPFSVVPGAGYRPPFQTYPTILNEVRITIFTKLYTELCENVEKMVEVERKKALHDALAITNDWVQGHEPRNIDARIDRICTSCGWDQDNPADIEKIESVWRELIAVYIEAIRVDEFLEKKRQSGAEHRGAPYDPSSSSGSLPSFSFFDALSS
ncbi:hypothetical protein BDN70DRAFT_930598 [Pholiota conissans]|uniref:Uncharacterized protein n=1 Tax=Pholiota conissans TaxID=109636 RepID=A0A9P5Z6K7_9AGAR|nr:hypothetical protein BDN70DRAFT_930598 [Pholiota conissans]